MEDEKEESKERDPRGIRITYSQDLTKVLDSYARLFASKPYSAIIYPTDKGNSNDKILYICTPGNKQLFLHEKIELLNTKAVILHQEETSKAKLDLFIAALSTGNSIAQTIVKEALKNNDRNGHADVLRAIRGNIFNAELVHKLESIVEQDIELEKVFIEAIIEPYFGLFLSDVEINNIAQNEYWVEAIFVKLELVLNLHNLINPPISPSPATNTPLSNAF